MEFHLIKQFISEKNNKVFIADQQQIIEFLIIIFVDSADDEKFLATAATSSAEKFTHCAHWIHGHGF
jgi:hypothetical protein